MGRGALQEVVYRYTSPEPLVILKNDLVLTPTTKDLVEFVYEILNT